MDNSAFADPQQQQQQQYQIHQIYDPTQHYQVRYDAAACYAYQSAQHPGYGARPSSVYYHYPYHQPAPPPPPPGAGSVAAKVPETPLHVYASHDLYWDRHHLAATQFQQGAPVGVVFPALSVVAPEQAVVPPQHPRVGVESSHRDRGRRGRWPFRGGSRRGNFGGHSEVTPTFHGRGRGRKVGGNSRPNHNSTPEAAHTSATKSLSLKEPMLEEPQDTTLVAQSVAMLPRCPILPHAWCDICRVDCNSLEVLEQHKNGKRHKKTVQRLQEMQAQQTLMADLQAKNDAKPEIVLQNSEVNKVPFLDKANKLSQVGLETIASSGQTIPLFSSDQICEADKAVAVSGNIAPLSSAQLSEANKGSTLSVPVTSFETNEAYAGSIASENLPTAAIEMEHKIEPDMQSQAVTIQAESKEGNVGDVIEYIEVPAAQGHGRRSKMSSFGRSRGSKRKMTRYWQDGKRLKRPNAVGGRPQVHQKERPRVCTLCNVMCETQSVFDCHLSGKKHISRIKRFQSENAVFGPISVYIPPNQPTARSQQTPEPLFFGLTSHEMFQGEACTKGDGLQLSGRVERAGKAEVGNLVSESQQHLGQPQDTAQGQKLTCMHSGGPDHASKLGSKEPNQLPVAQKSRNDLEDESTSSSAEEAVTILVNEVPPGEDGVVH